jgi:uncharacterized protein with PIN domain
VTVDIFFQGELIDFLPLKKRKENLTVKWKGKRSVKDLVESLCVPHTEVGGIRVNDQWVTFSYILDEGDRVIVFPFSPECRTRDNPLFKPEPSTQPAFICDVHLWKLARRLRLLGFNTYFNAQWDDARLADISQKEGLILLTRDRGLLIRKKVTRGVYIHSTDPEKQVKELLQRLNLHKRIAPFTRCLLCNGLLEPVEVDSTFFNERLKSQIPPKVLEWTQEYHFCTSCQKVFWKGSHYEKLIRKIDEYLAAGES